MRPTMMTRTWLSSSAALALASAAAFGDTSLFSNASPNPLLPALAPSSATGSGAAAPIGSFWSEVAAVSAAESNAFAGVSGQGYNANGAFRFAEDFTVPVNRVWNLSAAQLFAYQPGASAPPAASPFVGVSVQIWSGRPGDVGSTILWGDTATNRLAASSSTGIYRVFNSTTTPATAPDTARLIWQLDAAVTISLQPGTYWLDWQIVTLDPFGEAFAPTATLPGSRTVAGWNAIQFKPAAPTPTAPSAGGVWSAIADPGKPTTASDAPQALPFILRGTVGGCIADFNSSGGITIDDLFLFFNAWFTGDPSADFNSAGGVTVDDLFLFINAWFVGCP